MDTRDLRAFVLLSETLHFGQAAQAAHLSPSALSRTIQRLETELGSRLFERNNREVRLTRAGRVLQAQARELLERLRGLRAQIANDTRELQGSVSLYCSVTASYSLLAGLLPEFRSRHPAVEVNVHTGDEASALLHVTRGREDLAIAAHPGQLPAGVAFLELAITPLVFIVPAAGRHALPALDPEPARWATLPMILPEAGEARERIDRWFAGDGVVPNIYAQVSGNEAIVGMVALGCGVGVVPQLVLRSSPFADGVRVLEAGPALDPFRVGLCCRKSALTNPLVAAMWELAAEVRTMADT